MSISNSVLQQKKINLLNQVLDAYVTKPTYVPANGEINYKCINPKCLSHKKKKDKLCINIIKENCHCWVCNLKVRNLSYLIRKIKPSFLQSWNEISDNKNKSQFLNIKIDSPKKLYDNSISELPLISNLSHLHPAREYLLDRGINVLKSTMFNLRYVEQLNIDGKFIKNSICVPSHSFDGIDFLFFRSIDSSFKFNCKSEKTQIIFNDLYINWSQPICLVEGIFDALKLFPHIQTIPLLGSSLSKDSVLFKKIYKLKPKIIVCLDPDALDKQFKILEILSKWGIDCYSMETEYNDLGDSTEAEIKTAINNILPYNYQFKIRRKIIK